MQEVHMMDGYFYLSCMIGFWSQLQLRGHVNHDFVAAQVEGRSAEQGKAFEKEEGKRKSKEKETEILKPKSLLELL